MKSRAAADDPLYIRLASEFRRQIDNGVLSAGDKLPSIRGLQRVRRVSTATVMEAYLRLERDGYVRARDRSGFYVVQPNGRALPAPDIATTLLPPVPVGINDLVSQILVQSSDTKLVPLGISTLGPTLLPISRLNRAFRRALTHRPLHSATYGAQRGDVSLRRQIARRAIASGFSCNPDDIVVTNGGLDALNLALRAVASPGEVVAVESPTYFGVLQVIELLGLKAVEVPTDPQAGIDLGLLDRIIRRHRVKAVVTMPTCHNPLGSVMGETAKADLIALTARHETAVIEDAVYADLVYDDTERRPAKAFDRKGLVILCGSFSKVLAPGLRVGWVEAGRFRDRVQALKSMTTMTTSALPQLAVAELLESGFYDRYIRRLRVIAADQTNRYAHALSAAFPSGTRMTRPSGGTLLWVQLPKKVDGSRLYRRALDRGIGIFPGEIFSAGGKHRGYVRISCGALWSPAVERAVTLLGSLCRD